MKSQDILIREVEDYIALLTLNRPDQVNALNKALILALRHELEEIELDDGIRVIILTGQGSKAFCAGIDVKERALMPEDEVLSYRENIVRPLFSLLGRFAKPTIAAVNGATYGGGAELALACDIRIASSEAKFAQSEITWGIIPACGACQRLRMLVGVGKAKELIFTGRAIEAEEALEIGIYNRVVPSENLIIEAKKLASEIAKNSPIAVRQAKKAIDIGANISQSLDFEFEVSKECYLAGEARTKGKKI